MAPHQRIVPSGSRPQKGFVRTVYDEATNPENKTIVRSIVIFGVRVALSTISTSNMILETDNTYLGRYRVPSLKLRRVPPSSVSRSNPTRLHRDRPNEPHLISRSM